MDEKIGDVLAEKRRPIVLDDHKRYELITVKRRSEGVVSRGHLSGRDILVKNYAQLKSGDFVISKRQVVHGATGIVPPALDGAIVSNEYLTAVDSDKLLTEFLTIVASLRVKPSGAKPSPKRRTRRRPPSDTSATTPGNSWPNWSYGRQRPWATPRGPSSRRKSARSCMTWRPGLTSRRIARMTPGEIGSLTPAQACCLPSAWQRCSCFQPTCPFRVAGPSRSTRPRQHCKVPRPRPRRVRYRRPLAEGRETSTQAAASLVEPKQHTQRSHPMLDR